jgi:hypothetical protein
MKPYPFTKSLLLTICLLLSLTVTHAQQKLPNKQVTGVWASPGKIKMDGKATEWDNFQAYNTATDLYYTLANSNDFVYLVVQIQDPAVVERANSYGFTFEIYKTDKPGNKELISITMPPPEYAKYFSRMMMGFGATSDAAVATSMMKNYNSSLQKYHKFLVVKGIPGFDTISVYNDEPGIRLADAADIKLNYTFEIQLPVKFIKLLPGDNSKFLYRLAINGMRDSGPSRGISTISANGTITSISAKDVTPEQQAAVEEITARIAKRNAPTDFKGEYVLVKE